MCVCVCVHVTGPLVAHRLNDLVACADILLAVSAFMLFSVSCTLSTVLEVVLFALLKSQDKILISMHCYMNVVAGCACMLRKHSVLDLTLEQTLNEVGLCILLSLIMHVVFL